MANAAVVSVNLIDRSTTTLSAQASIPLAPPGNLINPHVGKKWRDNAASSFVLADLAASSSIDTVMLAGVSGTNPTFRVRMSTVDATGAAGDAHDSGSLTGSPWFDRDYGLFVYLAANPVAARYVRVDIAEGGVSFIEAGRWSAGVRNTFETNMQAPWSRSSVRGSVSTIGVGGQTFVDLRRGYWAQTLKFDFMTELERTTFVEDIGTAIVNNGHLDMLWIRDTATDNLSRDSVWGYLSSDLTTTQNLYIIPALYSAQFEVRERL